MAQNFIFEWYRENKQPLSAPFPMRILSEQTFGKKALLGSYWEGVIDITDKEQVTIFENYLGIGS